MTLWARSGVLDLALVLARSLEEPRDLDEWSKANAGEWLCGLLDPGLTGLGPGLLDFEDPELLVWEGPGLFDLELLKDIFSHSLQSSFLQTQPLSYKAAFKGLPLFLCCHKEL